jgi:type IV secretory pathway VirB4 component
VIGKDGGLRQIVMVGGVNFALKSDMDQTIMTQAYQNFLNGIEFPFQVVIHSRKVNIEKYADDLLKRKEAEPSPIIQNQIEEYVQFIKGFVEKNAIMEKMFFAVVPFYPTSVVPTGVKSSGSGLFGIFGKKSGAQQSADTAKTAEAAEKYFKESLEQLNQRADQVMAGLEGIGLEATVLNDEQLTELFYNFYNPQTVERKEVIVG